MAPRATWKGFLNLSLVSVPVKAYSAANSGGTVRLNQLHAECNSRINLKTSCPSCGEISRKDIVKGYEFAKNQYVVIDLDDLEKLRTKDETRAIRIEKFIEPTKLDPIYLSESSYYLVPDGAPGQKPYALLREAMERKGLVSIAHIVLHNKEQLALVRPVDGLLCMTLLRFATQLKNTDQFSEEIVEFEISKEEFKLAETLIAETTTDEFNIHEYSDVYTERLTKLIETKVEGKELVQPPDVETQPVINLMDALKASVAQVQDASPEFKRNATPTKKKVAKVKKKPASKPSKKAQSKSEKVLAEKLAAPKKKKAAQRKKKSG
jgi:DNA end-binding protein Ku